ncbi:baseplate J/gp47 family protein [Acetanaerobacterium elongatum]|uniref:Uncharacterized phage protein gp47/JayE n=1 Tax=Acetanaerobacterium elongatum TaxID=258515 RepID=A0A1G9Z3K8_9FIRM|nr:baseplate J/gp47 family protein [Acetanaerobacterium elongatum]SDN15515.1 Uncharacterized phage protein gp47/JayE [Acetanaerobacterium elongatum]
MAENYEFRYILNEMLAGVPDTLDKREGSIIYDTLAPVAYEVAKQNYLISSLMSLLFPDTSQEIWLDRNADNFGLARREATCATRRVLVQDSNGAPLDVPLSSRFRVEDLTLQVTEKIAAGEFKAVAEQAGTIGNRYTGELLPVDNIVGLGTAMLADVLIPASDTETDEELRGRLYDYLRKTPFGGNIADYEQKTLGIEGVGAVAVFTAQNIGAGLVRLIIADEQIQPATEELITRVKNTFVGDRNGTGMAPIGHLVTVGTASLLTVDITAQVKLKTGASFALIEPLIKQAAQGYIGGIGFKEGIVYRAKLISHMLNASDAILDVRGVTINGAAENLTLTKTAYDYQIPSIGTITVTEVTA